MPGIVGIVDHSGKTDVARSLARMSLLLKHRPWYTTDRYLEQSFGMARIGLGYVNPEPQPIFNENRTLVLMMDGEIYGQEELKENLIKRGHRFRYDNDPECILHWYEEYGRNCLKNLNGTFTFALWNKPEQQLIIGTDRHGLKPLYYFWNDGILLFASELKAILKTTARRPEIEPRAVAEFFTLNQLLGTETFFKGIHLLSPASTLEFYQGDISLKKYWDYTYHEDFARTPKPDYLEEATAILQNAVKRRLPEERPGLLLSGGLDSRTIYAALPESAHPLHTYTFGMKGCPDDSYASQLARIRSSHHRFFELRPADLIHSAEQWVWITDGMCNCIHFTGVEFFETIRQQTPIVLLGLGGGEYFGESFTNPLFFTLSDRHLRATYFYKNINWLFRAAEQPSLFRRDYYHKIRGVVFDEVVSSLARARCRHPANIIHSFFLRELLPRFIALGMVIDGSWVVVRTPFLDNEFIDFLLRLPPRYRLFSYLERKVLTRLSPAMAQVPWQRTGFPPAANTFFVATAALARKLGVKIPFITRSHATLGFHDHDQWLRTTLREYIEGILLSKKTLTREYFDPGFIRTIIGLHMSGERNFALKLCGLLTFELWHRSFIDG